MYKEQLKTIMAHYQMSQDHIYVSLKYLCVLITTQIRNK